MPAKKYTYGNGSRKSATATARLYKGKGDITINDKPALEYLSNNKTLLAEVTDPLAMVQKQKEYDICIHRFQPDRTEKNESKPRQCQRLLQLIYGACGDRCYNER